MNDINCEFCQKKLKRFWKNKDWEGRSMHKSCWKKKEEINKHMKLYLDARKEYLKYAKMYKIDEGDE